MAGASMNDIKARIKSVNSTMQITKAMELVATSKLRRAKMRAEQSRAYGDIAAKAMQEILLAPGVAESPYTKPIAGGKACYVVIAGVITIPEKSSLQTFLKIFLICISNDIKLSASRSTFSTLLSISENTLVIPNAIFFEKLESFAINAYFLTWVLYC